MVENNIVLAVLIGLIALYFYLKYTENKNPTVSLSNYDKEINEILTKEEYKVKGKFD